MAGADLTQRNRYEGSDRKPPTAQLAISRRRAVAALTMLIICIFGTLAYATVDRVEISAHAIVLGGILLTMIGTIMAVNAAPPGLDPRDHRENERGARPGPSFLDAPVNSA